MFIFRINSGGGNAFVARLISIILFVFLLIVTSVEVFYHSSRRDRVIHFNFLVLQTAMTYLLAYGVIKRKPMLITITMVIQIIACVYAFAMALYHFGLAVGFWCRCGTGRKIVGEDAFHNDVYEYYCLPYCDDDYRWSRYGERSTAGAWFGGGSTIGAWILFGTMMIFFLLGLFQVFLHKKIHVEVGGGHEPLASSSNSNSGV
ncbi:hypothetical protein PRIPAC_84741 [Pristionchus pacificus]|uniref:Uncharacterized protein n=1 Tax=Pristionchus pacificus TaxID=54126 RepID=A0A2A6BMF8_PRIPA|nr:hypothetical protein PRIPAC_84741 [Pristionchus pacificus]|eukprot:PDM67087.1 hypothetical protein PRIPAC_48504 [Pristionchus pacificus]